MLSLYLLQGSIASIDERAVCCESASASVASSFLSPDDAISVNSVELASPAREGDCCHYQTSTSHSHPFRKRSKSRLSLNLIRGGGNNGHESDRASSPVGSTSGRSPSLIPKFLRSSFSRLLSKDRKSSFASSSNNTPAVTPTNDHAPISGHLSSSSFPKSASSAILRTVDLVGSIGGASDLTAATSEDGSPEVQGFIQDSPDTAEYFEQTKLDGLPVIPFAFPTSVVAERLKNKKSSANAKLSDPTPPSSLRVKQKTPSGDSSKSEPRDILNKDGTAVSGRRHRPSGNLINDFDEYEHILGGDEGGPKSLDHLESLAQQELLEEEGCGSYNIYEDSLSNLRNINNNNNNNNNNSNSKKRKDLKMKPKRRLCREPSSEEGYVQMAPNVSSRNPSPSPTPSSFSPSSSSFSPSGRRRR